MEKRRDEKSRSTQDGLLTLNVNVFEQTAS